MGFADELQGGGIDLWRWSEGGAWYLRDELDIADEVGGYGQIAVGASAGWREEAVRNFALHEKDSGGKAGVEREEFIDYRRRDVIRQITGDDRGTPLREVGCESVGVVDV